MNMQMCGVWLHIKNNELTFPLSGCCRRAFLPAQKQLPPGILALEAKRFGNIQAAIHGKSAGLQNLTRSLDTRPPTCRQQLVIMVIYAP